MASPTPLQALLASLPKRPCDVIDENRESIEQALKTPGVSLRRICEAISTPTTLIKRTTLQKRIATWAANKGPKAKHVRRQAPAAVLPGPIPAPVPSPAPSSTVNPQPADSPAKYRL